MQNAIVRINELQNEIKEQSKSVKGSQQYIEQQVKLYKQDEALRNQVKSIEEVGKKIANDFFKHNITAIESSKNHIASIKKQSIHQSQLFQIDESTKRMIANAVKTSQAIEGYTKVASAQLQKEVARIMKIHNVKISTHRE